MNPNHPFNGSFPNLNLHSFSLPGNKQGSQLFNLPAPNMYAPLQYFPPLSQPKPDGSKHPSSFDLVMDPTKRVKHEQNSYTESGFKMEDVPLQKEELMGHPLLRGLGGDNEKLLKVENDLTMREDLRNLTVDPAMRQNPFGPEIGNEVPPELLELLKNQQIDQFSKQQIAQQYLLKQLEQQRAEAFAKQEMLKRLQQQQFEMLMQQKLYQQLQQTVSNQILDQMKDSHKKPDGLGGLLNQPNLYPFLMNGGAGNLPNQLDMLKGMGLDEISNPYLIQKPQANPLKDEQLWKNKNESADLARKKHNNPLVENNEIKNNQLFMTERNKIDVISPQKNIYESYADESAHEKEMKPSASKEKAKPKKRRSYNYSYDYFNALSSVSIEQKLKSENRRKNKWQMMAQENDESLGSSRKSTRMQPSRKSTLNDEQGIASGVSDQNVAGNQEFVENAHQIGTDNLNNKGHKNPYLPEDDSNIDWEQLLSRTITKIPDAEENFAVIDHRERMAAHYEESGADQPFDTKVGNAYQAAIPELDLTDAPHDSKKRRCELIWSPKALDEAEIERYLSDLCQILNCQSVNQEKALKLLKRKNYKKDKVKVNISKNEKFYSSFLVAMDPIKEASSKENP